MDKDARHTPQTFGAGWRIFMNRGARKDTKRHYLKTQNKVEQDGSFWKFTQ